MRGGEIGCPLAVGVSVGQSESMADAKWLQLQGSAVQISRPGFLDGTHSGQGGAGWVEVTPEGGGNEW